MSDNLIVHFDSRWIKDIPRKYVAWVDIMGMQNTMKRSINVAANFVFKFQMLVSLVEQEAPSGVVTLRMMDGCYVFADDARQVRDFLQRLFQSVADDFIRSEKMEHKYIIRGAVAHGPIVFGNHVFDSATGKSIKILSKIKDSISVGMPISQAYSEEGKAPPFGIFVHEAVRSVNHKDSFLSQKWLKLFENYDKSSQFMSEVAKYFKYCEERSCFLDYPIDRISEHNKLFTQYMVLHEKTGEA